HTERDAVLHDTVHVFRRPEHIHQIRFQRKLAQTRISLLAEYLVHCWPNWNDVITETLQGARHAVARTISARAQTDDRDGADAFEEGFDFLVWGVLEFHLDILHLVLSALTRDQSM